MVPSRSKNFNLAALFGSAKNIFVTEDSAMMISESIIAASQFTYFLLAFNLPCDGTYSKIFRSKFNYKKPIEDFLIKE